MIWVNIVSGGVVLIQIVAKTIFKYE